MKKLLGLLAVAAFMPVAANADVLSNVNLKGEIQTIASDVKHNTPAPAKMYNDGTSARVLAGLSADLVEDVTANLMFQYANIWGSDSASGRSVQNYWDNVTLVEANVVLHNLFCCLEATVGRQFYGDEDSAVMYIGPNHYNAEYNGYTQSLDALKITYGDDVKALTVVAGRINDSFNNMTTNLGPTPAGPDYTVFGADFRMNLTDALTAQVYGYDLRDAVLGPSGDVDSDAGFYGAKLALNPEDGVRLAAEYARNFGGHRLVKEHNNTGDMVKVDAAVDVEAITVRGTFYYATENFFAMGNYTPGLLVGHLLGGAMEDYTATNAAGVAMFNLGFDMKPADKWTVSLDGYSFQDKNFHHTATYEADLTAKYDHNEYVQLFAGVGYAHYAKHFADFSKEALGFGDNVKGQLGMLIKF